MFCVSARGAAHPADRRNYVFDLSVYAYILADGGILRRLAVDLSLVQLLVSITFSELLPITIGGHHRTRLPHAVNVQGGILASPSAAAFPTPMIHSALQGV